MKAPRVFALTREVGDEQQVVGYGLVLPGGSAYAVSWPDTQGASIYSSDTAERCAELRDADLHWLVEKP